MTALKALVSRVQECCPRCGVDLTTAWKYSSFGGEPVIVARWHWCYMGGRR